MKRAALSVVLILLALPALTWGDTPPVKTWPDPDRLRYEPLRFTPAKPERVVLENGLAIYFLEDRELPVVNVSFLVGAGSILDPKGKEGLAELTGEVMRTGGAGKLTGDKVDEALETLAAPISISFGMDYGTGSLSVLKKDLPKAFELLSNILRAPRFEQEKLELQKNLKLEELRRIFDKPQRLAFREFRRALYAGNPRGRLSEVPSIERIERDDLAAFHRAHVFPRNLRIAVTGDLSREEAIELVSRNLGDWDEEGDFASVPLPRPQENAPLYFFQRGVPQSTVIIGNLAPGREAPDYYAFTVLDHMLGSGGFRSKLFQEIRSNRGLAYSAGSFYEGRQGYGSFGAYAITKSESTGQVLSLMSGILKEARESSFAAQDVHMAKRSIVNSYIFSFTSPHAIAFQQMLLEFQGLPTNFLAEFPSKLDAVTRDDVLKAAEKYLDPERKVVFVLGDAAKFDRPLKEFGTVKPVK